MEVQTVGAAALSLALAVLMGAFFLDLGGDSADWITWLLCWGGLNYVLFHVLGDTYKKE